MKITIYHNPQCSKSRKSLEFIRDVGIEPTIVEYLTVAPDAATILQLAEQLGIPVSGLLRRGEELFKDATDLPELTDNVALAGWLERNPRVIERPIVVNEETGNAVIGRPAEKVPEFLKQ
jgi:arsenate reductase